MAAAKASKTGSRRLPCDYLFHYLRLLIPTTDSHSAQALSAKAWHCMCRSHAGLHETWVPSGGYELIDHSSVVPAPVPIPIPIRDQCSQPRSPHHCGGWRWGWVYCAVGLTCDGTQGRRISFPRCVAPRRRRIHYPPCHLQPTTLESRNPYFVIWRWQQAASWLLALAMLHLAWIESVYVPNGLMVVCWCDPESPVGLTRPQQEEFTA
ncbi:hypothetical protein B0T24DRAFT_363401 [Lasiosphaeria ovina]|uniref:Uncharacterized protein n=1 Tax=Lasiosphaeria ovina TaxID=92902 RepID=A0AAE0K4W1_9PEZI|nr:hypothetical protein B0T24DRAFT_363401 [Lasiosphaeria ovina]